MFKLPCGGPLEPLRKCAAQRQSRCSTWTPVRPAPRTTKESQVWNLRERQGRKVGRNCGPNRFAQEPPDAWFTPHLPASESDLLTLAPDVGGKQFPLDPKEASPRANLAYESQGSFRVFLGRWRARLLSGSSSFSFLHGKPKSSLNCQTHWLFASPLYTTRSIYRPLPLC